MGHHLDCAKSVDAGVMQKCLDFTAMGSGDVGAATNTGELTVKIDTRLLVLNNAGIVAVPFSNAAIAPDASGIRSDMDGSHRGKTYGNLLRMVGVNAASEQQKQ